MDCLSALMNDLVESQVVLFWAQNGLCQSPLLGAGGTLSTLSALMNDLAVGGLGRIPTWYSLSSKWTLSILRQSPLLGAGGTLSALINDLPESRVGLLWAQTGLCHSVKLCQSPLLGVGAWGATLLLTLSTLSASGWWNHKIDFCHSFSHLRSAFSPGPKSRQAQLYQLSAPCPSWQDSRSITFTHPGNSGWWF